MQPTIAWIGDEQGRLELLDQTRLPAEQVVLAVTTLADVVDAIRRLCVRGAPAIGVAAGYGMVIGVREREPGDPAAFRRAVREVGGILGAARPTAINLTWAIERMRDAARVEPSLRAMLAEARAIHVEDVELCRRLGAAGAHLIRDGMTVLTHCNTGRLATAGEGTALAVLFAAWREGRRFRVLADETRPLLQGARLTALELVEAGIPVDLCADAAAAGLIARGDVDLVITGADRIARNGDVANKVGTYGLALAAHAHAIPMFVAAPASTFDLTLGEGAAMPIEERDAGEVLHVGSQRVAASGAGARNPAFDVTPARYLAGLITDRGLIAPVSEETIKAKLG
jgi:methylthioribose-1-phosphate isomerase